MPTIIEGWEGISQKDSLLLAGEKLTAEKIKGQ
jgi:hypothetical protein